MKGDTETAEGWTVRKEHLFSLKGRTLSRRCGGIGTAGLMWPFQGPGVKALLYRWMQTWKQSPRSVFVACAECRTSLRALSQEPGPTDAP